MATQHTTKAGLRYWQLGDRNWHLPYQETCLLLDALAAVGGLAVRPAEIPSTSLNVRVAGGSYRKVDGTPGSFAGEASLAVPASSTRRVWLEDDGTLDQGSDWPSADHVRLATVVTDGSTVTAVTDERIVTGSVSSS